MQRIRSESGAVLIHVAIALVGLLGFLAFVTDHGVLMLSRNQAQNSADGGALAGAIALAYDDFADRSNTGPSKTSAQAIALSNLVYGQAPDVQIASDVTFVPCPDDPAPPPLDETPCIRVDVYRNQARNNPLPVMFGQLLGLTDHGVRATATAEIFSGNVVRGMRPWAIPDRFVDNCDYDDPINDPGTASTPDDGFDSGYDTYDPDLGYEFPDDIGALVIMHGASGGGGGGGGGNGGSGPCTGSDPSTRINPGWYQSIDFGSAGGGNIYRDRIVDGYDGLVGIGDQIPKETGNMVGPTQQGTGDLIDLDPLATWDPATNSVVGSCVGPPYTCSEPGHTFSPRIVPIPVFDPVAYFATGGPGAGTVTVIKIFGFFIEGVGDHTGPPAPPELWNVGGNPSQATVWGRLVAAPGDFSDSYGYDDSSFLKVIRLVR